jgi:HSP20 family molecular chaperone IbpA
MSGKVDRVSLQNNREYQTLRRNHKSEVDKLGRMHDHTVRIVKDRNEMALNELNEATKIQASEEVERKERILAEMKETIEKSRKISDDELKRIQGFNEVRKQQLRTDLDRDIGIIREKYENHYSDLNDEHNQKMSELQLTQSSKQNQTESQFRTISESQRKLWDGKIRQQRDDFSRTLNVESLKFDKLKNKQEETHKDTMVELNRKNSKVLQKTTDENQKHLNQLNQHHQKAFKETDALHEKKYAIQQQRHLEEGKNLTALHQKNLHKYIDKLEERKELALSRGDDEFFSFTELRPDISETAESVKVRLRVPEYAKDDVRLTINQKEIVLTAHRRYKDQRIQEGVTQKVDKVESLVSRIPTSSVLNERKLQQNYAQGWLEWTIAKA